MDLGKIAMDIIGNSGEAKSHCMNAIKYARNNEIELIKKELELADEYLELASNAHLGLLSYECETGKKDYSLLLIHAEDSFMAASALRDVIRGLYL